MDQALVRYEIRDRAVIVTIDHPPLNALDVATREALAEVFAELDTRRRELVLRPVAVVIPNESE